jgi:ketosteroid isomerase-like protein
MTHADVTEQILDAIRRGDAEGYAELFVDDAVLEHPLATEPLRGRALIRDGERALFDAFSEVDVELRSFTSEGSRVAIEVVLRATNTGPIALGDTDPIQPTGRRIEVPAVWIFEFGADGLASAERDYFDTAVLMSQLGLGRNSELRPG